MEENRESDPLTRIFPSSPFQAQLDPVELLHVAN